MSIHTDNDDFAAAVQARQAEDRIYAFPLAMQALGAALATFQRDTGMDEIDVLTDAISDLTTDYAHDLAPNDSLHRAGIHAAGMRSLERGMDTSPTTASGREA